MHFRQKKTVIAALIFSAMLAVIISLLIRPSAPAFMVSPKPNGYETLLDAARQLGEINDALSSNNIAEFVQSKGEIYESISHGLKQQFEAPPETYHHAGGMKVMQDLIAFRKLERALSMKSKSVSTNNPSKAADLLIDSVRLGQQVEHGPLICFLVGSAIEINATKKLGGLLPQLNTNGLLQVFQQVQELNKSRLSYDEIEARERYYVAMNTRNPFMRLKDLIKGESKGALKDGKERYLNTVALEQVILGTIAIRLFTLQEGRPPGKIDDLFPRYAGELRDPYSGTPLIMKTTTNSTFVYSVGLNGTDDSGRNDDVKIDHEDTVGMKMVVRGLSSER